MRHGFGAQPLVALATTVLLSAAPARAWAQDLPELEIDGLLRTGLRVESARYDGTSGFEVFDARLGLSGKIGIVFDYALRAEYQFEDDAVRLLDARLSLPLQAQVLRLEVGVLRSGFGREALLDKGELPLVERSQGSLAIAPGRQVGAAFHGAALEERLMYRAGLYNGEGVSFGNDDRAFLFAARVEYNSVGEVEFFEDFVYEFGIDLALASDSANPVLPVSRPVAGAEAAVPIPEFAEFTGDRFLWSADAGLRYREWSVAAEYARGEYDPQGGTDSISSEGWFVQGGYSLWGAFDLLARYDSFEAAAGLGSAPGRTEFLVFGLNVNPGFNAKIGMQYAVGLNDTLVGVSRSVDGTNTGPALADRQFLLNLQVSF